CLSGECVEALQSSLALCPVNPDLNGWLGDHQISQESPSARLPRAATDAGKRSAFPTVTTLGLKPCCAAWFQKVAKSGGVSTPVTISTPAFLNAEICDP